MKANDELKQIAQEVTGCMKCRYTTPARLAVPGEGPANANIMNSSVKALAFTRTSKAGLCGRCGKVSDEAPGKIGMKRSRCS